MTKISIYQVLPRLFGNPNKNPKFNGSLQENGCGKMNDFTPEALKAIKKLGINYVWYTGIIHHATSTSYPGIPSQDSCILKGKAGSPYAIVDYYDVHPDLAVDVENRMAEFEELVKRTHDEGMKVIIDFVPNHVSRAYRSTSKPKGVPDFGETDDSSLAFHPQNNFYYLPAEKLVLPGCQSHNFQELPAKVTGNDCFSPNPGINDWYETIKLNYGVDVQNGNNKHFNPIPSTWFRMLEILKYWTNKGIDGFRCDMAEMVPVEFWGWVIPQIKQINGDIIFIAEVYQPDIYHDYIFKGKFDYLYDKVGLYDMLKAIIRGEQPASNLSDSWKSLNGLDKYMLRFLENHDEQRIASSEFAGQAEKAIPAMVLSATMHQGPVMTYFGQEFGENSTTASGFSGDDGRTTIFDYWNIPSIQRWKGKSAFSGKTLSAEEKAHQQEYSKILNLAMSHPAIGQGSFYDLMWANKDNHHFYHNYVYAYLRSFKTASLLIVLNFSARELNQKVIISGHALEFAEKDTSKLVDKTFKNIFTGVEYQIPFYKLVQQGFELTIKPFGYQIFEF